VQRIRSYKKANIEREGRSTSKLCFLLSSSPRLTTSAEASEYCSTYSNLSCCSRLTLFLFDFRAMLFVGALHFTRMSLNRMNHLATTFPFELTSVRPPSLTNRLCGSTRFCYLIVLYINKIKNTNIGNQFLHSRSYLQILASEGGLNAKHLLNVFGLLLFFVHIQSCCCDLTQSVG